MSGCQKVRRSVGQEDGKAGQEIRRAGCQDFRSPDQMVRSLGCQMVKRSGGQEDKKLRGQEIHASPGSQTPSPTEAQAAYSDSLPFYSQVCRTPPKREVKE